jgi:hypothetical protein
VVQCGAWIGEAKASVARGTLPERGREYAGLYVVVVVHLDDVLAGRRAQHPACVLHEPPLERDRRYQEQGVESGAVEALPDVRACRDHEQRSVVRPKPLQGVASLIGSRTAPQHDGIVSGSPEQIGQDGDVRGPLGEDQTVSSAGERSQDVDEHLLAGRPANRTHQVLADKGYSSKANRAYLRRRGIHATIPERRDQQANRARRGSAAGGLGAAATAASASPASLLGSRSGPATSASTRAVYFTTDLRDKCSAPAQAITPMATTAYSAALSQA